MVIPEGVKDKKAYLQYLTLSKNPILNKEKMYYTSDGLVINLASFHNVVRKKVEHLPHSEQKIILDLKDEYCVTNNKLSRLKQVAFGNNGKLTRDYSLLDTRKEDIMELFGKFHNPEDVTKIAQQEWGLPIGLAALKHYYTKHKKTIDEKKELYRASYSDVRLGVKRSRLEELTYLYNLQKEKYEDKRSTENYRLLLSTLEQIRKEAEGDRLTVEGKIDVNYEVNIQQHMRDEVFRTINLKEIILGRVAARMGVNPIKLIHSLNASYYKQFSNVLGAFNEDETGEVVYPSQLSYDFERIGKAQSVLDRFAEDAVIVDEEKTKRKKNPEHAQTMKDKLAAMLKQKQKNISTNNK